jgi:hypothetical protein
MKAQTIKDIADTYVIEEIEASKVKGFDAEDIKEDQLYYKVTGTDANGYQKTESGYAIIDTDSGRGGIVWNGTDTWHDATTIEELLYRNDTGDIDPL